MRMRSKTVLAVGAVCLATGVFASGALAHGGHREKLGKISKKGHAALKVEVRGVITSITAPTGTTTGSVVLNAAGGVAPAPAGFEWTCTIPVGSDVSAFVSGDRVKAKCRSAEGTGLTLTKLRHKDRGDKVKVEAFGLVSAFTAFTAPLTNGTVTVQPGTGLPDVTCAVTDRTRVKGTVVAGTTTAKVECKSKNGALVAKKIKVKVPKARATGTLTVNGTDVTVGSLTCANTDNVAIPPGITPTTIVEIKCEGNPLVLKKIEIEDDDD